MFTTAPPSLRGAGEGGTGGAAGACGRPGNSWRATASRGGTGRFTLASTLGAGTGGGALDSRTVTPRGSAGVFGVVVGAGGWRGGGLPSATAGLGSTVTTLSALMNSTRGAAVRVGCSGT